MSCEHEILPVSNFLDPRTYCVHCLTIFTPPGKLATLSNIA
jgi:hypothetical protein